MLQLLSSKEEVSMDSKLKCLQELKRCVNGDAGSASFSNQEEASSLKTYSKFRYLKPERICETISKYKMVDVMLN